MDSVPLTRDRRPSARRVGLSGGVFAMQKHTTALDVFGYVLMQHRKRTAWGAGGLARTEDGVYGNDQLQPLWRNLE